jgi:hypothetical protein
MKMALQIGGTTVIDNSRNLVNIAGGTVPNATNAVNATTATTLQTARTIGGVSFDGSANINLPGVNTAGNQNTSGTAAVSTAATVTTSTAASAFKVPFANTTASTTGNYGLLQDSEATFTYNPSTNTLVVGTVSGALSGNSTTATTLQTARTIGGVSFNGSANINLPGVNAAGNQNTTGSAATLTTARTLTIGSTGKTFNGSANVTWSLAEIGAGDVTLAGTQTLTNKTLGSPTMTGAIFDNGSVRSNIITVAALDINCSLGNYFIKTISANSTFTFSSVPTSTSFAFTLELTHTGGTVTWPTTVRFPNNTAPSLTTSRTHLFVFVTDDGGVRWRGAALIDYLN